MQAGANRSGTGNERFLARSGHQPPTHLGNLPHAHKDLQGETRKSKAIGRTEGQKRFVIDQSWA